MAKTVAYEVCRTRLSSAALYEHLSPQYRPYSVAEIEKWRELRGLLEKLGLAEKPTPEAVKLAESHERLAVLLRECGLKMPSPPLPEPLNYQI